MTPRNSQPSSEAPGFSPAHSARAEDRALRSLIAVLTLIALGTTPHAQVQGTPPAAAPPAVGTGLIAGQVVDADSGRPVPGATVMLIPMRVTQGGSTQSTGRPAGVMADSQGRFYFGALSPGSVAIQAQMAGYTPVAGTRSVDIPDGARIADIKLTVRKLGSLGGRVVDDSGTPVVSVEMVLLRRTAAQGRPPALLPVMRTRSDDRGEYRFAAIAPGEYFVCACLRDPIPFDGHLLTSLAARPLDLLGAAGRAVTAGSDAVSLAPTLTTLPVTFFPGVTVASQAEPVRVTFGEDKTGVDMTMTAVRAGRVSGRIVGATSSVTAAHLRLRVMSDVPEAAGVTQLVPMLVQPDGRFDFANVPPGQYILDVNFRPGARGGGPSGAALAFVGARGQAMQPAPTSPQGRGGGPVDPALAPLWAQEVISVGDRDVTGLVIALNRSVTVTGRFVFSGSAPQPAGQVMQRLNVQLTSIDQGSQMRLHFAQIQSDGTFQIGGVIPGRYVLNAGIAVPPWLTMRSVTSRGDDLTDKVIEVDAGDVDIVVAMSDAVPPSVTGRVTGAPPAEGTQTWVRAFPADRRLWFEPFAVSRRFRTTHAEPDGRFSLPNLPTGEYFLFAASEGGSEWMTPELLESMARTAERVRVNDGDKLVVEVRR